MKIAEPVRILALSGLIALAWSSGASLAQVEAPTLEAINLKYERELVKVEKARLEAIGRLALSQPREQKTATLETYFRER